MIPLLQQILKAPSIALHPHEPTSVDDGFSGVMLQTEANTEVEDILIEISSPIPISAPQPWLIHWDSAVLRPKDAIPDGPLIGSMPSPIADQSEPEMPQKIAQIQTPAFHAIDNSTTQTQLITPLGRQVDLGLLNQHSEPSDVLLTMSIELSPDRNLLSGDFPVQTAPKTASDQGAMAQQSHHAFVQQAKPALFEIPTVTQSGRQPAELEKLVRPKPATQHSAWVPLQSATAVVQSVPELPTQTPSTTNQSQNALFARIETHGGHVVTSDHTGELIQQTATIVGAAKAPMPKNGQMPASVASPSLADDQLSPRPEVGRAALDHLAGSFAELGLPKEVNATAPDHDRIDLGPMVTPDVENLVVSTEKQLPGPIPNLTSLQSTPAAPAVMPLPTSVPAVLIAQVQVASTGPVELVLDPEELGKVRFQIHHQGEQLRVVLVVERPETLDLLRRNVDQLVQEFRNAGFATASFSFGQSGGQQGGASQQLNTETASDFDVPDQPMPTDRFPSAHPVTAPTRGLSLRL